LLVWKGVLVVVAVEAAAVVVVVITTTTEIMNNSARLAVGRTLADRGRHCQVVAQPSTGMNRRCGRIVNF